MIERLKQDLLQQWQASSLLRQGVWGIGIVLLIYGVLWLDDQVSLVELELQRQVDARAELRALEQQQHWPSLVQELSSRNEQWREHAWPARTVGLARASIQEFIQQAAAQSAVNDISIRNTELAQPQPFGPNLYELRGRMTVSSSRSAVPWDWLATIDGHSPWLIIDSLNIRVGSRSGVTLQLEFRVLLRGLEDQS